MPASREPLAPVRDRAAVVTSISLLLIAAVAWADVIRSSLGAPDMMMTMFMPVTLSDGLAFVASWGVMMTAMMLPSALPMIGLYAATQRGEAAPAPRGAPVAVFTLVYLAVWAASGVPVYLAHTGLMALSPRAFAYGVAAILLASGVFQLSPLKQACLRACRSPLGFLLGHWRAGLGAALPSAGHTRCTVSDAAGRSCWSSSPRARWASPGCCSSRRWWRRRSCCREENGSRAPPGERFLLLGVAVALRPDLVTALRGGHAM